VPGSSAYFLGGVVAYANELKIELLGVPPQLIARDGAVSASVALAMAAGARSLTGGDLGLGVSGIAGPVDGPSTKPPGLCYVGLVASERCGGTATSWVKHGDRGRDANRADAVRLALRALVAWLDGDLERPM
jgi:PncC family amidohydrolase